LQQHLLGGDHETTRPALECLHFAEIAVRRCLSLARLTGDTSVRQRLEELALNFAERIGGEDDLDVAQIFAGIKPSKIKDGNPA